MTRFSENFEFMNSTDSRHSSKQTLAKPPRNQHIEMLRVLAIMGIAVFHVFLSWFEQSAGLGAQNLSLVPSHAQVLAGSAPSMWLMSSINLLGSWGNHVFYMISGFFLIPSLAEYSHQFDYWRSQIIPTLKRVAIVVVSVLLYGIVALMVNAWLMPLPGAGTVSWWGMGLEFIWLYLCFVALAPLIAWVIERIGSNAAQWIAVGVLISVYALNIYIAYASQGDVYGRGLSDWRKQMSAVTYLVSFIFAGLIGQRIRSTSVGGNEPKARQWWRQPTILVELIAVMMLVLLMITGILVSRGEYTLLYALSFKSTSLISFVFAVLALLLCASVQRSVKLAARTRTHVISALAPGILGFYIAQSLMHAVWFTPCYAVMQTILGRAVEHSEGGIALELCAFFIFGILFALVIATVLCIIDHFLRQPLLRALHLAK